MSEHASHRWPTCPACAHRRETACPVCGTAGTDFAPADYLGPEGTAPADATEDGAAAELLLVCGQCDEVFPPQFYRYCPACGHDFGTGLEPGEPDALTWSPRLLFAIGALVLCGLALLGYFALLLR